jgi:hypothetical protein
VGVTISTKNILMSFDKLLDQVLFEGREIIKDADGRIIGFFEQRSNKDIVVYNASNRQVGVANNTGTWLYSGRRISINKEPALLFAQINM